ncbi:carboxylesterase family protein [Phenylobacterium sp.]|uniref:carboxylesterase/lipase family protein n=1 Tax=Phenylobacterium sp. TaxID=1871053 RepID=UPI0025DD60CF|nr:carboxylesterase family protein [Phenylobacterium sp.]MBX3482059.1 carboxylesterase family protein [Phenylobacterium sp.]
MIVRSLAAAVLSFSLLAGPALAQAPGGYQPPAAAPAGAPATLTIGQGVLKGSRAEGVDYFYAIPFAPAPVGDLRWRPPGAAPAWTGERDATEAPPSCQSNEDCLYLNVVRPAGAKRGARLPVIVWIHGSAFRVGQAIGAFGADTEGTEFAKKGVIVVGVNHRLGRAGWFAHPALTKEPGLTANYGNMDQIAALKWVQANIAAFGGDPRNVTAVGESAGAMGILNMMISPEAKGLFQRAVVESGFARTTPTPLADAEATGVKLAEAAGVTGDGPEAAAALRKLPLSALGGAGRIGAPGGPFPVMDGRLYAETVIQGFTAGHEAKIPLIIGGNSHEASLVRPTAAMLAAQPAERQAALMTVFGDDKGKAINDFVTVQSITEPDRAIARLHARNGAPMWLYYFSYVPAAEAARKPYGAAHVDEVRFVFGQPRASFAGEDLPLSDAMNRYWANFARTGRPGAVGGVAWPKFDLAREAQIEFGAEGPKVREHLLKDWRDFVEAQAK